MKIRLPSVVVFGMLIAMSPVRAEKIQKKEPPSSRDSQNFKDFVMLDVTGIDGKAYTNAMARLNIEKQPITSEQSNIVKLRFYQDIPKTVRAAIEPYGYFKAQIQTKLARTEKNWTIRVHIIPGPRLRWTKVDVHITGEGLYDPDFKRYQQYLPIQTGQYLNTEDYESIKETLQTIASQHGYFEAKFTKTRLQINLLTDTAEATIHYDTGPRYKIGAIHFSKAPVGLFLLNRYLTCSPGDPYNQQKLEEIRKNLSTSNYFSQVLLSPEIGQALDHVDHTVPIQVNVFPQNQVTYSFGAGYGTDTGVRGMIATNLRWINESGHSANFQIRGSQYNDEIALNYIIPGTHPAQDSYRLNAGLMNINQSTGTAKNVQSSFLYQTQLRRWRITSGVTYLIENYTLNNFPTDTQSTHTNANVFYPQMTLQKMYAHNSLINPDYGYNITLTGAVGDNFESNTSFSQVRTDLRGLYTFMPINLRLLFRGSLGSIAIDDLSHLPLSMQFYAGGAQSIRGYEYNSIGPGSTLAVGSFEIQQKIAGNFYLAGFIDAGNVSDAITEEKIKIGAGPGFVYLSPVGAIEISFGKQLADGPWAIQFSMGTLL